MVLFGCSCNSSEGDHLFEGSSMKVTVTTMADAIYTLDVNEDLELENFKAFCEVESGIPASQILIVLEGRPLIDDKKTLKVNWIEIISDMCLTFQVKYFCDLCGLSRNSVSKMVML